MTELEKLLIENEELFHDMRQCWANIVIVQSDSGSIQKIQERIHSFMDGALRASPRDRTLLSVGCYVMATDIAAVIQQVLQTTIEIDLPASPVAAEMISNICQLFRRASGGLLFMEDGSLNDDLSLEDEIVASKLTM